MMRWITGSSVRLARLVTALALAVVALGVAQLRSTPVDTYPEFMPPMVQVRTEALGLSAAEVEQLVTVPLEQDLLNGLPWLDEIRSESLTGLSSVDLVFEPGTDVLRARQMIQERLSQAAALPNVGGRPGMVQPLSSTSRVLMIGLSSKELSLIDMSVLARWKIRPRLMGIPGVANVAVWGQRDRQLQVQVNPDRLAANGITLDRVVDSTGNALWSSPLTFVEASTPGTGGFIDTANQRLGVQHMMPITTSRELAAVTLQDASGRRLRLSNVADVVEDHQPLIGDAMSAEGPSLMLVVQKFPGADTARVTRDVERAMDVLEPGLSGIRVDTTVFRPASFLESSLRNVGLAGGVSLLLVLLLLVVLAASWRVALIAFVALPVSLVVAAYVLYLRGTTFSSITLVGLVAALGVVIDDAVGDSDHIRRGLARRPGADRGPAATEDVVEASQEVRRPLLYATLVLLVLVAPLAVVGGVAGAFSRELAVSLALAVLASMAVALTLTPALSFLLLRNTPATPRERPVLRLARRAFDRGALHRVRRPRWAYATVAVFAVAGLAVVPLLGSKAMLPAPHDRDLLVELHAVPGTSLTEMARITNRVSREIDSVPGVRDVGLHVGRAVTSDQVVDVDSAEVWLNISRSADYSATVDRVRNVVDQYRGLRHLVTTYEQQQLGAAQHGSDRPLVVRVYGQDLPTLRAQAERVRRSISSVDGVQAPRVEAQPDQPTLQVEVDLARAERQGVRPGDVRRTAATLISGLLAGNLYQEQKVFDVVVWGTPTVRQNLSSVENLLIDAPGGRQVRLRDVDRAHGAVAGGDQARGRVPLHRRHRRCQRSTPRLGVRRRAEQAPVDELPARVPRRGPRQARRRGGRRGRCRRLGAGAGRGRPARRLPPDAGADQELAYRHAAAGAGPLGGGRRRAGRPVRRWPHVAGSAPGAGRGAGRVRAPLAPARPPHPHPAPGQPGRLTGPGCDARPVRAGAAHDTRPGRRDAPLRRLRWRRRCGDPAPDGCGRPGRSGDRHVAQPVRHPRAVRALRRRRAAGSVDCPVPA